MILKKNNETWRNYASVLWDLLQASVIWFSHIPDEADAWVRGTEDEGTVTSDGQVIFSSGTKFSSVGKVLENWMCIYKKRWTSTWTSLLPRKVIPTNHRCRRGVYAVWFPEDTCGPGHTESQMWHQEFRTWKKDEKWDVLEVNNYCFLRETVKPKKTQVPAGRRVSRPRLFQFYPEYTKNSRNSTVRKQTTPAKDLNRNFIGADTGGKGAHEKHPHH